MWRDRQVQMDRQEGGRTSQPAASRFDCTTPSHPLPSITSGEALGAQQPFSWQGRALRFTEHVSGPAAEEEVSQAVPGPTPRVTT